MKKVILSLVVVAALSTACKKNYTCTCTAAGQASISSTAKTTKSVATTNCNNEQTTFTGYTCTVN